MHWECRVHDFSLLCGVRNRGRAMPTRITWTRPSPPPTLPASIITKNPFAPWTALHISKVCRLPVAALSASGSHTQRRQYCSAGIIGLNNIKRNDYVNVVIQALSHVGDLRDFFLRPQNYPNNNDALGRARGASLRLRFGHQLAMPGFCSSPVSCVACYRVGSIICLCYGHGPSRAYVGMYAQHAWHTRMQSCAPGSCSASYGARTTSGPISVLTSCCRCAPWQ